MSLSEETLLHNKMSEPSYRDFILSPKSVSEACDFTCNGVRNCSQCLNERLCKNLFSRSDGPVIIRAFREQFFILNGTVTSRRLAFLSYLNFCTTKFPDEKNTIVFRINNETVCKVFWLLLLLLYHYNISCVALAYLFAGRIFLARIAF